MKTRNIMSISNTLKNGPRTVSGISRETNLSEKSILNTILMNLDTFDVVGVSISDTPLIALKIND